MAWVALVTFLIPLIYLLARNGDEKHSRSRELELIRRRLDEKAGRAGAPEEDSGVNHDSARSE